MKTPSALMFRRYKVAVFLIFALITSFQYSAAQSWYNTSWQYRIPVTIDNTGSGLTAYQVNVTLGPSFAWGHAQAGGGDVFFTAGNGSTPLDFYLESWAPPVSASIWVR
jgi:accessory colonization factor AcfC